MIIQNSASQGGSSIGFRKVIVEPAQAATIIGISVRGSLGLTYISTLAEYPVCSNMLYDQKILIEKINLYCSGLTPPTSIVNKLGHGTQGIVFSTSNQTAVKSVDKLQNYVRERNVYKRLSETDVTEVCGLVVPRLLGFDDSLQVIEMSLVAPPFLVDFGGAYLDKPPEHMPSYSTDQGLDDRPELFGIDWDTVKQIIQHLIFHHEIYLVDIHPGNIRFRN